MYNQLREDPLYIMLYAVVTAIAMMASCYLLFRRANAIAPDVTPPSLLPPTSKARRFSRCNTKLRFLYRPPESHLPAFGWMLC